MREHSGSYSLDASIKTKGSFLKPPPAHVIHHTPKRAINTKTSRVSFFCAWGLPRSKRTASYTQTFYARESVRHVCRGDALASLSSVLELGSGAEEVSKQWRNIDSQPYKQQCQRDFLSYDDRRHGGKSYQHLRHRVDISPLKDRCFAPYLTNNAEIARYKRFEMANYGYLMAGFWHPVSGRIVHT